MNFTFAAKYYVHEKNIRNPRFIAPANFIVRSVGHGQIQSIVQGPGYSSERNAEYVCI